MSTYGVKFHARTWSMRLSKFCSRSSSGRQYVDGEGCLRRVGLFVGSEMRRVGT